MPNHVFGPVPSRRLGRSLGVDLVPYKTCTYDCIYCQLGPTTCKTVKRKEWVPLDAVLTELQKKIQLQPDWITLSGSGEPTLYSRLDELIDRIKRMTDIPVAVLTNGSLLWMEAVQRQLARADMVMPSLDVGNPSAFQLVNRPHKSISFEKMLSGLEAFRKSYHGQYWLEVLLVAEATDNQAELDTLQKRVAQINPDRVLLNTVTRPPAELGTSPVPHDRLEQLAATFSPPAEILSEFEHPAPTRQSISIRQEILDLLARRPCSIDDIAGGLSLHKTEVLKQVDQLRAEGRLKISSGIDNHQSYYRLVKLS